MIAIGCDHGGYELKKEIEAYLDSRGLEYRDYGCDSTDSVDYPIYARKVAHAIVKGECERGILICGTGIGISIAANKVPGIRAGVCSEPFTAKMIAEHNNCQIVAMGARVVGEELAKMICDAFFDAEFQGGRHQRRVDLISKIEEDYGYSDAEIK